MHRFEAALGGAGPDHPPSSDRLGEALETLRAEVGQLEQATNEPARPAADDHPPGLANA
jgi:hypothetical protein